MKIELSKKEKWAIGIIGLIIISLPAILTRAFQFGENAAYVGDTLGGITAPFLGFFGSILVYLALRAQIDANAKIQEQFEKQNNDQLFFRLIDKLNENIVNYSTSKPNLYEKEIISSYNILPFIVEEFKSQMETECVSYGRHLLAKIPEQIGDLYYMKIIDSSFTNLEYESKEKLALQLKDSLLKETYNERWEMLKAYFKQSGKETDKQRETLFAIGSVYFYKTSFNTRYDIYNIVFQKMFKKYGGFLITYFNTLKHLLFFIKRMKDNKFYIEYLDEHLTSYEKALIFYFIADYTQDIALVNVVKEINLIKYEDMKNSYFIDIPSKKEFDKELEDIYNFDMSRII